MADRDQIQQVKDRLDILSVIQTYVPNLKKSGQNYFGLCPFHSESSPSFSVNSALGLFKCFGCGEGGDVIAFLQKIEGLDFPHALELAAKKAGVVLQNYSSPEQIKRNKTKQRLLEANKLACEYFSYMLLKHKSGEHARNYVAQRKLTKKVVDRFKIGYAPSGFNNLKNFLLKKGYKQDELVRWGLLAQKDSRSYDKFRDRLMFPIFDHQGDVVGFSGRLIEKEAKGPKYLNSPETPVYKKSEILFGLYQAKEAMRKHDKVVIVEGNVDPLSSHRVGIEYIVAPMGTALTIEQLKLLKRYTKNILLAFDTDNAGQKAFMRSLELAQEVGVEVKALDLGKYKDVDELIVAGGNWESVIEQAKLVIDYLIDLWSKAYDLDSPTEVTKFTDQSLELVKQIDNNITRELYLERVSLMVKLDVEILRKRLANLALPRTKATSSNQITPKEAPKEIEQQYKFSNDERYLASLVLQYPKWTKETEVNTEFIENPVLRQILAETELEKKLSDELKLTPISNFEDPALFRLEVQKIIHRLKEKFIKAELQRLKFEDDNDENLSRATYLAQQLRN